jgi:hypothetical protein
MLSEPASSLTDLLLGVVAITLALRLRGAAPDRRQWYRTFAWTGAAALAGAIHHGVITYSERWSGPSWAVISGMVVIAISYLLAASVTEVLGPGRWRAFWLLRSLSLGAYAILALLGHAGIGAILACEGITMVAVLALWGIAAAHGHPRAPGVIAAILASGAAAALKAAPLGDLPLTFDTNSVYHLAQIPGLVLLWLAVRTPEPVAEAPTLRLESSGGGLGVAAGPGGGR